MTSDEHVFATLSDSGIAGTKVAWTYGGNKKPPLPWFVYRHVKRGEFYADDSNFAKLQRYEVDLYQSEQDDEERDALEEQLSKLGPYACIESWVPMESSWLTSYTLTYHPDK